MKNVSAETFLDNCPKTFRPERFSTRVQTRRWFRTGLGEPLDQNVNERPDFAGWVSAGRADDIKPRFWWRVVGQQGHEPALCDMGIDQKVGQCGDTETCDRCLKQRFAVVRL